MEIIEGDILISDKDIIVQQVNCLGLMGAGLALSIMKRYDNVKKEYIKYRNNFIKKGHVNRDLLGHVNYVDVYDGKIIANIFGQCDIRKGYNDTTVYTEKEFLLKGIKDVEEKARNLNLSIAIPTFIGCGMANGDWDDIKKEIENVFIDSPVDVVFYHYR